MEALRGMFDKFVSDMDSWQSQSKKGITALSDKLDINKL